MKSLYTYIKFKKIGGGEELMKRIEVEVVII